MEAKLRRNLPVLFLINGLWMFLILMPVIVPFFHSRGLSMEEIFILQAIFSGTLLLAELPSGYISDLMGRKKALIIATILHGIGFTLFPFAEGFWLLVVAEIIMGIGLSLFSGTDISLIYDSLEALGEKKAPIKLVGRKVFYMQLGETAGGLVGGWLAFISIDTPAIVQACNAWLPLIAVLFITEPARKKMDKKKHKENLIYIYTSLFKHSKLLNYIILNSVVYSVCTILAAWSFQKHWLELGVPLHYFGYLWAGLNLIVAVVGRNVHKLEKRWGSVQVLVLMGVLPIIGYFGMGLVGGFASILFAITFQVARPVNAVVLRDALNKRVTGDMRATANSVVGLGMRSIFIILGPLAGFLIDKYGIQATFIGLGFAYILAFFAILWPLLRQRAQFIGIP